MTLGLTYHDEERDARQAVRSQAHLNAHERRRLAALKVVAEAPNGTVPVTGVAPLARLRSLEARGLVEVRYHLTPAGRKALAGA